MRCRAGVRMHRLGDRSVTSKISCSFLARTVRTITLEPTPTVTLRCSDHKGSPEMPILESRGKPPIWPLRDTPNTLNVHVVSDYACNSCHFSNKGHGPGGQHFHSVPTLQLYLRGPSCPPSKMNSLERLPRLGSSTISVLLSKLGSVTAGLLTFEPTPHPVPSGLPSVFHLLGHPPSWDAAPLLLYQVETEAQTNEKENDRSDKDEEQQYLHEAPPSRLSPVVITNGT